MNFLKKLFINDWEIILDDNSIQLFINKQSIPLGLDFNADNFLMDQSQFVEEFNKALKKAFKNYSVMRPAIGLVLKGKLQSYKNSSIFQSTFMLQPYKFGQFLPGRSLEIK